MCSAFVRSAVQRYYFFGVHAKKVIFCYIFLRKYLHGSVIFCNFAADFVKPLKNGGIYADFY